MAELTSALSRMGRVVREGMSRRIAAAFGPADTPGRGAGTTKPFTLTASRNVVVRPNIIDVARLGDLLGDPRRNGISTLVSRND